ncbi:hypothetical protein C161_27518 [Paenibacillus sp. FSL R5-192]|nr:hypothetical protein C161_27518 [Paenibacillus sp. FSL R5-192]
MKPTQHKKESPFIGSLLFVFWLGIIDARDEVPIQVRGNDRLAHPRVSGLKTSGIHVERELMV